MTLSSSHTPASIEAMIPKVKFLSLEEQARVRMPVLSLPVFIRIPRAAISHQLILGNFYLLNT
jgi:hypothetical protein